MNTCSFRIGTPVVFNDESVINLSEEDAIKYYGCLGYKQDKRPLFIFLCEILNEDDGYYSGHCVLLELGTNRIEAMRHTSNFRLATEDEI